MDNFTQAFTYVIGNEGGYTNDPKDLGNWTGGKIGSGILKGTKYGISAASYPNLDIKNLTLSQAQQIYKNDFWDKNNLNLITSSMISIKCFDMLVNMGSGNANPLIQLAIKSLNETIIVDGNIGPKTIDTINSIDEDQLFNLLECASGVYYWTLSTKYNKSLSRYLTGWLNRAYKKITKK